MSAQEVGDGGSGSVTWRWKGDLALGNFRFRPVTEDDVDLLHRWINEPHVREWWDGPLTRDEVAAKVRRKLASGSQQPYLVFYEGHPLGYLACYQAAAAGDGWWPDEPPTTFGVDLFIGDPARVNRGLGRALLCAFTDWLLAQPGVERVITDPNPENARAIHCYRRAGFTDVGRVHTPDGSALLLEKLRPLAHDRSSPPDAGAPGEESRPGP